MNTSRIDHESEATPAGLKVARRRPAPFWQEQKDKHVVGDALISGGAMMLEVRRTERPSGTYGGSLNWDLTAFGSHAEVGHMPAEISPELRAEFERWKNLIAAAPNMLAALRGLHAAKKLRCSSDPLNPCLLSGVQGKHWGGGDACPECCAIFALAGFTAFVKDEGGAA